ncbi:hypothetical protein AB0B66_09910 [Catellatospora sp. NPDC049111]|uniref:hypothetical protein n=1 Tax=Catellatospora sp. NPDC049111 TaxID=3155271 RepID=UPI0033FEA3E6
MSVPDLRQYRPHRVEDPALFEGERVMGLRAKFFHREEPGRTASAGTYWLAGRQLLMAWGFADEEHCRFHAVCDEQGRWGTPVAGCPQVQLLREGAAGVGLLVADGRGAWIGGTAQPAAV